MKVYLHLEEESSHDLPEMTVKLTLPKSWQKTGFDRLKKTFVTSYNKKHSKELEEQDWHLESADGKVYAEDAAVKSMISSGADLYMRRGAGKTMEDLGIAPPPEETPKVEKVQPPPTSVKAKAAPKCTPVSAPKPADKEKDKRLVCKRFGCQARYLPGDNHEEACRYHAKPPIFHETRKWWACCPKKVAWDWDTFTAIPGCMVGAHSDVAQDKKFMGGADVRAEQAKAYEYAPKPIGKPKTKSSLEKLGDLRKALSAVGVDASAFDAARDAIKARHEDLGVKVWDKVCEELSAKIQGELENMV